ncbi:MAG: hypothetical protein KY459_13735 [Acidobacteria bacterium]|nr:hypothetical protein [Acidobacteriota bacterium]
MGFLTWVAAGLIAFGLSRLVKRGRVRAVPVELMLALCPAILAGIVATALDFGGWAVFDVRAGLFALATAFAILGFARRRGHAPQPE